MKLSTISSVSYRTGTQATEVFCGLGDNIRSELQHHAMLYHDSSV